MQFPITLHKSDTCILYEMPVGKPDPHGSCGLCPAPLGSTRVRVLQAPRKGDITCVYYAMNFLRERVGKNPCEAHKKQREIEVLVSNLRKKLTACEQCTHEMEGLSPPAPWARKLMRNLLEMDSCAERIRIHQQFIEDDRVDLEEKGMPENQAGAPKRPIEPIHIQAALIEEKSYKKIAHLYQLKFSSWRPNLGITGLIHALKEEGPLCIGGTFGCISYIESPFEMRQKIHGRAIYAWRPQATRAPEMFSGNVVLLVGARQEADKAYVYFIDSKDPSDPQAKEMTQRIYMISYRNFHENLRDLSGAYALDSPHSYAYRGNFLRTPQAT